MMGLRLPREPFKAFCDVMKKEQKRMNANDVGANQKNIFVHGGVSPWGTGIRQSLTVH